MADTPKPAPLLALALLLLLLTYIRFIYIGIFFFVCTCVCPTMSVRTQSTHAQLQERKKCVLFFLVGKWVYSGARPAPLLGFRLSAYRPVPSL